MIPILALLLWVWLSPVCFAADPGAPLLRIETGQHTAMIKALAADADGRYLVSASEDKTVRVWEVAAGALPVPGAPAPQGLTLRQVLRPPIGAGNEGKLFAVAISPDGATVACGGWTGWDLSGNATVYFFDRASGRLVKKLDGFPNVINALAYSRDGRRLAVALGAGKGIYLVGVTDWKLLSADAGYGSDCYGLDFDRAGRLVTASWDGLVRLYDSKLRLMAKEPAPNGERPYSVAFSPDGSRIAVGCDGARKLAVISGKDLKPLYAPPGGAVDGSLFSVAWSPDGSFLYAAGSHRGAGRYQLRRWEEGGQGSYLDFPAADGNVMALTLLTDGRLALAAAGPQLGLVSPGGRSLALLGPSVLDYRDNPLTVSADGASIGFGYGPDGSVRARFAVAERSLSPDLSPSTLALPRLAALGLQVADWHNGAAPLLNGLPLPLQPHETSRSLALFPDGSAFLLGTDWYLRCYDRQGRLRWRIAAPGIAWGVNVSADGKLALAAFGDGSIRWFRLSDGRELLSFFPHADRRRWVLNTPLGYYDASVGGEDLAGWQLNRGAAEAGDFFPISRFRAVYYRPDLIDRILAAGGEGEALKLAGRAAGKEGQEASIAAMLPPVTAIVSPADRSMVEGAEATVNFTVRSPSDAPVTGVRVLVNGRPVGFQEKEQGTAGTRSVLVPIPSGDSEIAVIAENRFAAGEPSSVRVTRETGEALPEVLSMQPRLFVLAIGVGAYREKELTLKYAAKDARDFAALLKLQQGGLYGEVSEKVLVDGAATRQAVLDGLAWLRQVAGEHDTAVVFLSGHGVTEAGGGYYYLPVNADSKKPATTALVFSELRKALMSLPGKAVLFVDTCHAGDVMGGGAGDVSAVVNELSGAENGVVVFASSTGRQSSLEDDAWQNGAFTKALVEGVSGKADYTGKGRITVTSLDLWLSERVQELTGGRQTPTTAKPRTIPDFPLAVKR